MSSEPITCPYCNSLVPVPQSPPPGQRLVCPRCGEAIPSRVLPGAQADLPASPELPAKAMTKHGWSNAALAGMILAFMGMVALTALTVFLLTQEIRRQHDLGIVRPPRGRQGFEKIFRENLWVFTVILTWALSLVLVIRWRKGFEDREPTAQPAPNPSRRRLVKTLLGLWSGVGLVMAVAAGWASWHRAVPSEAPPAAASPHRLVPPAKLAALGYLPADTNVIVAVHVADALSIPEGSKLFAQIQGSFLPSPANVEKWTGLTPRELDHVVLGARFAPGSLIPRLLMVVQTVRPYDPQKVAAALKKAAWLSSAYRLAKDDVIVLGTSSSDLQAAPEAPFSGIEHLPGPVKDFLEERLGTGSQLWLVGHMEDWAPISALIPRDFLSDREREVLMGIRTFGFGVHLNGEATISGQIECADGTAAAKLERYLKYWEKAGLKHFRERDSSWVSLQSKGRPEELWKNWPLGKRGPNQP